MTVIMFALAYRTVIIMFARAYRTFPTAAWANSAHYHCGEA